MEAGHRLEKPAIGSLSRRELLRRTIVLGLSEPVFQGLLAACRGSSDEDRETPESGTAAAQTTPTAQSGTGAPTTEASGSPSSEEPRRGGTFNSFEAANPPSLDPYVSSSQGQAFWSSYSYSRLFMLESGPHVPSGSLETTPDAAISAEISDDGLQYTVKLRDNVYWHRPLDRLMTADDVIFSWNRLTGNLPGGTPSPRLEDIDFVTSCEKIDDLTVRFTLEAPYPFFLLRLADPKVFFIMPEEVGSSINPAEQVVGSGPWILEEYVPDNRAVFRRHEKWHLGPERPYYDNVIVHIVPEYPTQLSQFLGGNLDWIVVNGSDLARVLDAIPDVQIYERPPFPLSVLNFSPHEERWEDERLRRAVSMALDRDAMLDAAYGLPEIEATGIQVTRYWHNYIPAGFSEYWLDPKGDEIDPEVAANFRYDPETARQLVEEAGGPFETELHYAAANSRYGEPYRIMSELIVQYLGQIGITVTAIEEDYNTRFLGENGTSSGNFNGLMWIPQTRVDPFAYIETQYLSPNHGIYGRWKDEEVTEAARAIRNITDSEELKKAIKGFQNLVGRKMYVVPMQYGAAPQYVVYQPWVRNAIEYQTIAQGGATENLTYYWSAK